MREIGILYTPESVRALAEKRKTQTRRLSGLEEINRNPNHWQIAKKPKNYEDHEFAFIDMADPIGTYPMYMKSRYQLGDILYVKKARARPELKRRVTDIKVERVQDISEEDAKDEGLTEYFWNDSAAQLPHIAKEIKAGTRWWNHVIKKRGRTNSIWDSAIKAYRELWDDINAKPKPVYQKKVITHYVSFPWGDIHETREHKGKSWHICGNPYVFAYTFEELKDE
jgi:hypothetical protein